MNRKKIILLRWIPFILMLCLIFSFSAASSEESSEESNALVHVIVKIIDIKVNQQTLDVMNNVVRELAHFTEYFILGITGCFAITTLPIKRKTILLFLFCVLYAISDEIHQLFVSGRSCQLQDMIVDSLGSGSGILFIQLFIIWRKIQTIKHK